MEIQQLRHLLAAARHRNMHMAADEASISQSGLGRSIKSLEDGLGVPLLVRKPKGVETTPYGDCLIRRAKLILNEVERAIEEVWAIEEARSGEVMFGITGNYESHLVAEIMSGLAIDQPDLNIEVTTGGFAELIEQVKSDALDFGFGILGAIIRAKESWLKRLARTAPGSSPALRIRWPTAKTCRSPIWPLPAGHC